MSMFDYLTLTEIGILCVKNPWVRQIKWLNR